MEWERVPNQVRLRGIVVGEPMFSHENRGERYEVFELAVERLSGTVDRLPVMRNEKSELEIKAGMNLEVVGELRSFNNKSGQGRRLILTVYSKSIVLAEGPPMNELCLEGAICKPPAARRTPLGREICDFILAVNRKYGRADYLPCIAWGRLSGEVAAQEVGSRIRLEGRLQSRTYIKTENGINEERTAFEVSVMQLKVLDYETAIFPI